jgi:elongation factor Ts
MEITTEMIKELRAATNAGISDCRKALTEADGDFQKAVDWLREKGMATAAKRADREASQGVVELYSHGGGRVGVMVEVNCETDFVARSEQFRQLAHESPCRSRHRRRATSRWRIFPPKCWSMKLILPALAPKRKASPITFMEKIVQGRLEKFKDEVVLSRQAYIRDESITVEKLILQNVAAIGENVLVRRFQRWELGESLRRLI